MATTVLRSKYEFLEPAREIWRAKVHRLLLSAFLQYLGLCTLLPHSATVLTNYFAKTHADGEVDCTGLMVGTEPPEECQSAHNDIVAWNAMKSFLCAGVMGTLLTPLICRWSDYFGRKPIMIYGSLIAFPPLLIFAAYVYFDFPLWWYYPAKIVSDSFAGPVLGYAYISDVIGPTHRTAVFGMSLVPFALSLFLGGLPTTFGWLTSPGAASLVALALMLSSFLVLVFFVPESLSKKSMQAALEARASETSNHPKLSFRIIVFAKDFWMSFRILFRTKYFFKLAVCLVIFAMLTEEVVDIELQYLQEVAGFGTKDQAYLIALAGIGTLFVQSIGLWVLVSILQMSNIRMVILGIFAFLVKLVLLSFCNAKWIAYVAVLAGTPESIVYPATAAIKASYVANDEQGAVQGALGAAQSFSRGLGPLVFWVIFYFSRQGDLYFPAAPFVVCALLLIGALILAATIKFPAQVNEQMDGIEIMERKGGDPTENVFLLPSERSATLEKYATPL